MFCYNSFVSLKINEKRVDMLKLRLFILFLFCVICSGCNFYFGITPKTIHFDTQEEIKTFDIYHRNLINSKIVVTINPTQPWLEITPNEAVLTKGDRISIQLFLNRNFSNPDKSYPEYATAKVNVKSYFATSSLTVTTAPNYFTEIFEGDVDLTNTSLVFKPDDSISFYKFSVNNIDKFSEDSTDATIIDFGSLNKPLALKLDNEKKILFYGNSYDTIYISWYGWICFEEPKKKQPTSTDLQKQLDYHFYYPRISIFPSNAKNSGTVSYKQLSNRLIITYENVSTYQNEGNGALNTFQVELFFNGRINLNYLGLDTSARGVVGLSYGTKELSEPSGFVESDFVASTK